MLNKNFYFPKTLQNKNQELEYLWLSMPSVPTLYSFTGFFITYIF